MKKQLSFTLLLALCASAHAGTVAVAGGKGKQAPAAPSTPSAWDVSAAAGLGYTDGNTETLSYSAHLLASYITKEEEFTFAADYFYGESAGATNIKRVTANTGYVRNLSASLYAGLNASYLYDELAGQDARITVGPVVGLRLIDTDATKLAVEAGIGWTLDEQGGNKEDYASFYLGQKFSHTLSCGSKLTQSVAFASELEDTENFLLTADVGMEVPVSSHWALMSRFGVAFDNTPAAGNDEADFFASAGLSYSAQGFAVPAPAARKSLFAKRAPAAPASTGWKNVGGIGFSLVNGNSDAYSITASYDAEFRSADHELFYGVGGSYGEANETVNAQQYRANLQYNKVIGNLFYGAGASYTHNDLAGVDYRFAPAAVLGSYLVNNEATKLSLEVGPGYVFEKTTSGEESYMALYAAQKASIALSDTVGIGQSLVYLADTDDFQSYLLTATAYVDVYFADNLALRTSISNTLDNTPAKGLDDSDLTISTGLAIQF